MNGETHEEMYAAWRKYLVSRDVSGWNPRMVFYAGWLARSSGWSGTELSDDER